MNISEDLEKAFNQFVACDLSNDVLRRIVANVGEGDVDSLIDSVERLGDPGEYCDDDHDEKSVSGFFSIH